MISENFNEFHNKKIVSFFFKFFLKNFDLSIIQKIIFFENNALYELIINQYEINLIRLKNKTKFKCDLLIAIIDSNQEINEVSKTLNKLSNDLLLILHKKNFNFKINQQLFGNSFVELKQYNDDLENIFNNEYFNIFLKKVDSPNLDSSLLIQSICNDNGDKYIMMGYENGSLQFHFKQILMQIQNSFKNKEHLSYLRFGDGDFYFLRNFNHGSAKIGTRSVLKKINTKNLKAVRDSFWKIKNICIERTYDSHNRIFLEVLFSYFDNSRTLSFMLNLCKLLRIEKKIISFLILILTSNKFKFFGKKKFFYKTLNILIQNKIKKLKREDLIDNFKYCNFLPFEAIYALVSSRWIFKNYPKNIAVVGNVEKINLIKKLSKNQDYLDYLGIEKFVDFIEVPQKGAASDLNLSHKLKKRIAESNADIFLLGIGSMKIYLLPLLQDINKVFIDVGCGIDALAGVVSQDRPYFSRWINYQFENRSFDNIDLMDQNNPMRFAKKYSTVYIKEE